MLFCDLFIFVVLYNVIHPGILLLWLAVEVVFFTRKHTGRFSLNKGGIDRK